MEIEKDNLLIESGVYKIEIMFTMIAVTVILSNKGKFGTYYSNYSYMLNILVTYEYIT